MVQRSTILLFYYYDSLISEANHDISYSRDGNLETFFVVTKKLNN